MSDDILSALLRVFDLCVIECAPSKPAFDFSAGRPDDGPTARHSVLRLLTPVPDWLASAFAAAPTEVPTFGDALPFLDHFLVQAEAVWHEGHPASATSGPFVATINGSEVLLRAVAIAQHEHRLVILQRLTGDADVRPILQRAREQTLAQERLIQQVGKVHAPAAAIDQGVKGLLAAALPTDYQHLVERLSQANAELQGSLASLPAPTSRHRRQARKA